VRARPPARWGGRGGEIFASRRDGRGPVVSGTRRRIAVVPAYNEAPTVEAVLERLHSLVDELVVVDDGSTDDTRAIIERWVPGHDNVRLLTFPENHGMSAAYYAAFTELRAQMRAGELAPDDLVFSIDADGQHDLRSLY